MMTSFDYRYQNALRQAIVFSIFFFFFCEESLVRDASLHNKDCSEMHSGSPLGEINKTLNFLKKALSVLMLCAPVFIFTSGSMLWFIDLTVATCHIQYTFLSLCQFFHEQTDKTRKYYDTISVIRKWPPTVTRRAKH